MFDLSPDRPGMSYLSGPPDQRSWYVMSRGWWLTSGEVVSFEFCLLNITSKWWSGSRGAFRGEHLTRPSKVGRVAKTGRFHHNLTGPSSVSASDLAGVPAVRDWKFSTARPAPAASVRCQSGPARRLAAAGGADDFGSGTAATAACLSSPIKQRVCCATGDSGWIGTER